MTEEEIKHRFICLLATYLDHPSIYMEGPTQRNKRRASEVYDMLEDAELYVVQRKVGKIMGVKHSVELTRAEAEWKACQLVWRDKAYMFMNEAMVGISDDDLCRMLEILNDSYHDGEGFENYRIGK